MALASGDRLGDGFRLIEPVEDHDDSWRATDPEGELVLLRPVEATVWPDALFHPALVRDRAVVPGWTARRHFPSDAALGDEPGDDRGPLPVRDVFALGSRLAEALGVLHAAGIAHGNVSAATVLQVADRRPVLVEPKAGGSAGDDLLRLGDLLLGWLGDDASAADRALLEQARDGAIPAFEFRDRLEDARLAGHAQPLATGLVDALGDVRSDVSGATPDAADDARSERLRWIGGAVAVSVIALLLTLLILPDSPPPVADAPVASTPQPVEAVTAPAPPTEEELALLLEQRREAEAVLDAFIEVQLVQEERSVERWGAEAFEAALALAREAETPFREQDYERAKALYGLALEAMEAVAVAGDEALVAALERGSEALESGASAAAREAFELALAIAPGNASATAGLARAATLDEAMALRRAGEESEALGSFEEALRHYRDLLALDPAMPGAAEAPARLRQAILDRDFRQAMSEGLAALEIQDWGRARQRFEAAAALRPDAPAPQEFIAEAERRAREFVLASHRSKAAAALEKEAWEEAIGHYRALLKREPKAAVGLEGLALAEARAALAGELRAFVEQPASWWSDRGRGEARELIARAREVDRDLPRLRAQRERLAELLALAESPVTVTLRSDNACSVVVYRVARLGSFDERTLSLKPGRYTAVATRSGYRDVRKDFLVPAGRAPAPVSLICEEPV